MESREDGWRPAEQLRLLTLVAIEAIEVAPPHLAGFWRGDFQIGEGDACLHRPPPIAIVRVLHRAVYLDGERHRWRSVRPVAFELLRTAIWAELVRDDGIEGAAQRIPLQLEVAVERCGSDEELGDLLL